MSFFCFTSLCISLRSVNSSSGWILKRNRRYVFICCSLCCTKEIAKNPSLSCQAEVQMRVVLKSQDLLYTNRNKITYEKLQDCSVLYMCIKQALSATWQVSPLWEQQTNPESWNIAMKCACILWAVGKDWAAVTHHKNPGCSAVPAREAGKDDEVWMLSVWAGQLLPGLPLLCSSEPAVKWGAQEWAGS